MVFMVVVWRPTAPVLAVIVLASCATTHDGIAAAPVLTAGPGLATPASIFLPSGALPAALTVATTAGAPAATAPVDKDSLRGFLVVDADLPKTGIHVAAQPDDAAAPGVELCEGHDPATTYAALVTVGADIFTPSGNGLEIVAAYLPGVAEQVLAAITDAFGACARNAPITVGSATGTVTYARVRLSVANSHPEVTAATRNVTLGGATYESGLAYARFGDVIVLVQFDNIDAKTAANLLNRLLKAVVARHP